MVHVSGGRGLPVCRSGLASFRSGLYAGISITEMWSKYPEVGGGVQPCKRSFLLCKQSPVYCFPLLQKFTCW